MSTGGWFMMIVSLVVVWGGCAWCYKKILSEPAEEKVPVGLGA